jgi:outer membrane cobalamin receptor
MLYYKDKMICLLLFVSFGTLLTAQDTVGTQTLTGVNVRDSRIVKDIMPSQVIDSIRLEQIPAMQLSDAVKYFSGVTVKDYGGMGGLKTVSVRSLGANHTLVLYDDLAVSDCMSGQINISRFSMDNISLISLNNGNENDIFHSAKLFSAASVLSFKTLKPVFAENKPFNIKVSFCGGSFMLLNPSLLVENRIGKRIFTSINMEYLYNKGEYPFTVRNGDLITKEKRKNTDMQVFRTEANCFVHISEKQSLSAKIFYYYAQQGLPGAVILYNTLSRQRMWEENLFTQLHYRYDINAKFSYQAKGKMNYAFTRYLDPDYLNSDGKLDNKYLQREYYISNAVLYKPVRYFSMSFANDLSLGNMNTSMPNFDNPTRYSCLNALSVACNYGRINFLATLLHTCVSDRIQRTDTNINYQKLTPSAGVSYRLFKKENITVNLFYKNIFRLPTFNDLYYRLVGNTKLSPEKTHQINAGITWVKYLHRKVPCFSLGVDAYYNKIEDKIIAVPNKNLFVWSMLNLGKANITGVEVQNTIEIKAHSHIAFEWTLNYTYQYAVDVTDKSSKTYKNQIPYTPKHSGTGIFTLQTKWLNFSYSFIYSGERYMLGQNIPANRLDRYFDHNVALYRGFKFKKIELNLRTECINLLNKQYEVVKSYPMTGRQFQIKIILKL